YIRIFLDKGAPMISLLQYASRQGVARNYARKLLQAAGIAADEEQPGVLSERELLILRSIATGKSNQQIAGEFVVALSTVKTHLNNIYMKLGVHSRMQAIVRARELHLLG
ncbi:MAG TPA: LuxR C-terminal-related transcriptional regulator, partial [Ktedonobacteraceae bacterium]|nr:LuxR C-terminal-related transcriptional regulator [Ktedonobacteraceae bacterium]